MTSPMLEAFWTKTDKRSPIECWLWIGARSKGPRMSYGSFTFRRKTRRAHRQAWEFANGPIPIGLCVLHKCDTPLCVNPDHLEIGTQKKNCEDRELRGRGKRQTGEAHHSARLLEKQVREIRALAGVISNRKLADRYGVSDIAIGNIIRRRTWRHVL